MSLQNKNNLIWADQLRVLATVSVLLLHVSAPILYQYGKISITYWWIGNVFDSAVRFCVPVFLMLSGALILPKYKELNDFIRKRFSRIFLPFLFWSIIYLANNILTKWHEGNLMHGEELSNYLLIQFKKGTSYHLWYIYMIIGLYLFFPIISKWISNASRNEVVYFILIWFGILLMNLPFMKIYLPQIDFAYFSGYIGYPILGYYLSQLPKKSLYRNISFALFFIGILITIFATYAMTKRTGIYYPQYYNFLSPNVLISSIGVFLFIFNSNFQNINPIISSISKYSYGIYLSHVFVLFYLSKSGINWTFVHPLIGIPFTTFLGLSFSLLITIVLNKIPYGKYISG